MSERIGAGFNLLYYGFFDTDGNFLGGATTAPAAGNQTGSPLTRLRGARTIPVSIPEPEVVVASGDDQPLVSFEFDAEALANGVLETAQRNDLFESYVQGTNVNTPGAVGNMRVGALDPADRADVRVCLLLMRRSKSWTPGEQGSVKKQHLFLPSCNIKPLGNAYEQRTFNGYGYAINLSRADNIWTSVNDTEHGTTALSVAVIEADYPVMLQRWTGNNAQTVFNMIQDLQAGGDHAVWVNKVKQANVTNYAIAGGVLTFVAAPADAAVITAMWEFPEADIV
jgi:hypothetical protein